MKQKKLLYLILIAIVAATTLSIVIALNQIGDNPAEDSVSQTPKSAKAQLGDIVGENVTFTITEEDRKKWEMTVQRAVYYKDQTGARLFGISGEFYDVMGKPLLSFQAPKGEYNNVEKTMLLQGGVRVSSIKEDDVGLMAPTVAWSSSKDLVSATGGVMVNMSGSATSRASRCDFSMDFSSIRLSGSAHSEIDF